MPAVWVVGVPDCSLRLRLGPAGGGEQDRRALLQLPRPAWFLDRLRSVGCTLPLVSREYLHQPDQCREVRVVGLCFLQQGCPWTGPLCGWGQEADLLRSYLQLPANAFSACVRRSALLAESVRIERREKHDSRADRACSAAESAWSYASHGHDAWYPHGLGEDYLAWQLRDGRAVEELLVSWGVFDGARFPCVSVVEPIATLIFAGRWHTLVMRKSWLVARQLFPRDLWENLPDDPYRFDAPLAFEGELEPERFRELATRMREWAPAVLAEVRNSAGNAEAEGERLALESGVLMLQHLADALSPGHLLRVRDGHRGGFAYNAATLLQCLRVSRLLRGTSSLKEVCEQAVQFMFPTLVAKSVLQQWRDSAHLVPSGYTQHVARFHLDAALILLARSESGVAAARWVTADSSPQLSRDWLLSTATVVRKDVLCKVAAAARALSSARVWREAHADELLPRDTAQSTLLHEKLLRDEMLKHHFLPSAMGMGATTLTCKVAALLFVWFFECRGLAGLMQMLDSVVSVTTDLGTEAGITAYKAEDVQRLLPSWMLAEPLRDAEEAEPEVQPWRCRPSLLPRAIPVPGALHLMHNMNAELHHALEFFEQFWHGLKQLELLLSHRGRRERLLETCIRGSPLECQRHLFERGCGSLYEKRWGEVHRFCRALLNVFVQLRCAWDARKYLRTHGEEQAHESGTEFKPAEVTMCLSSGLFHAYLLFVVEINGLTQRIASWFEGCHCHEDLLQAACHPAKRTRHAHGPDRSSLAHASGCTLKGCRLPEMCAGSIWSMFNGECDLALGTLVVQCRHLLGEADWSIIVRDFAKAKNGMHAHMTVKFDWCKRLPWQLSMLGHYDQALARTLLGDVFQTFQRQSDQLRALHHARVLEVFEGSSADQFGLWLGGASLAGLPQLAEVAAELAMIPCVERAQEGEHATIKNRIISPRHGAVLVSLARRQVMLERMLQARPGYLRELTDAFTTVRSWGDLPALLGCAMHPLVLGNNWSAGRRQIKFVQKLSSILYRCSIADQFVDRDAEQRFHERSLAKDKRDQARIVEHTNPKPPIELNESIVLVRALVGHFAVLAADKSGYVFSLPLEMGAFPSLAACLHGAADHGLDADAPGMGETSSRLFFCVTKSGAGNWHTVATSVAAGRKLNKSDIIIRVLHPLASLAEEPQVCLTPPSGMTPVQLVISYFDGLAFAAVEAAFLQWAPKATVQNCLRGFQWDPPGMLSDIVKELLEAGAYEQADGTGGHLAVDAADARAALLSAMAEAGFVQHVGATAGESRWALTRQGVMSVQPCVDLADPLPVCRIRDGVPVADRTHFELMLQLRHGGWVWRRLPRAIRDRANLWYVCDDPAADAKVYYTSGVSVERSYLLCLLQAGELKALGIPKIPHGCGKATYDCCSKVRGQRS